MIDKLIAIFFILHGLIHLIGFVVPWKIIQTKEMAYNTRILNHRIDIGDTGYRLLGLLWLLACFGFVATGVGLWVLAPWWFNLALGASIFSSLLCISGWPESQFGLYINAAILGWLLLGSRFDWLPEV